MFALSTGEVVFDLGCGTAGSLSALLPTRVRPQRKTVGVDPYKGRNQLAPKSYSEIPNLFFQGGSDSNFPATGGETHDITFCHLVRDWIQA